MASIFDGLSGRLKLRAEDLAPVLSAGHAEACEFFIAETCAIAIECEHGYDVCPTCDPCTCGRKSIHLASPSEGK